MYNPLVGVLFGSGAVAMLPATGVGVPVTLCAAVGFLLLVVGLLLVRTARGGRARFSSTGR